MNKEQPDYITKRPGVKIAQHDVRIDRYVITL